MKHLKIIRIPLILLFIILNAFGTRYGFAFNCQKASQAGERFICNSSELIKKDNQLNSIFKQTFNRLSKDEKKSLLDEERDFLLLRNLCLNSTNPTPEACMNKLYKERMQQLTTWPYDQPQIIFYNSKAQQLIMHVSFNRNKQTYLTEYQLMDKDNLLNKGQFEGCTYGGSIMDIVSYLRDRNFIAVDPIKNGFAIHYMKGCGAQSIWHLNVITKSCKASVPGSDENGRYISVGNNPNQIMFGYLKGFGASREVTKDYLNLNDTGVLTLSQMHKDLQSEVKIVCSR